MRRIPLLLSMIVIAVAAASPAGAALLRSSGALPLEGTSFNGLVRAAVFAEGRFYLGGEFTHAVTGEERVRRSHLAAVDPHTGVLDPDVEFGTDGPVHALAAAGGRLYVAGKFTSVDGTPTGRVAAVDLESGAADPDFQVSVDALPQALAVAEGRVYLGGNFSEVSGAPRTRLAAVDAATGELDQDFAPQLDRAVRTIEPGDGLLYAGGNFTEVDGEPRRHLAAFDFAEGELDPDFAPIPRGVVFDLEYGDGALVAAEGGPGGHVQLLDADGELSWERSFNGDAMAVGRHGGQIYVGGHFDKVCAGTELNENGRCPAEDQVPAGKFARFSPGGTLDDWNPQADSTLGTYALSSGAGSLAAGGDFWSFGEGELVQRRAAVFRG